MKQTYEKPEMVTETVELGALVAGSPAGPVAQDNPFFQLCPPCPG